MIAILGEVFAHRSFSTRGWDPRVLPVVGTVSRNFLKRYCPLSLDQGSSLLTCFPAASLAYLQSVLSTAVRVTLLNVWSSSLIIETQVLSELAPLIFALLACCFLCSSLALAGPCMKVPLSGKAVICVIQVFALVPYFLYHQLRSTQPLPRHSHFPYLSSGFSMAVTCSQQTVVNVALSVFSTPFLLLRLVPWPVTHSHPSSCDLFVAVSSVSRTLPGKYLDKSTTWVECGCVE